MQGWFGGVTRGLTLAALVTAMVVGLAACSAPKLPEVLGGDAQPKPSAQPGSFTLTAVSFGDLPGWQDDNLSDALTAYLKSCEKLNALPLNQSYGPPGGANGRDIRAADWQDACAVAGRLTGGDDTVARPFFENWFRPYLVSAGEVEEGLFTGYFEAELHGSRTPEGTFRFPLYALPNDMVRVDLSGFSEDLAGKQVTGRIADGTFQPYFTRAQINAGALAGRGLELYWIDDPLDVFILHVQGSGRVLLQDGSVARLGYAGKNGYPYRSVGAALIAQGKLQPGQASWQQIRAWLESDPENLSALNENPSYIFFRELDGDGPIGAQGVPLTPGRSLAVDRSYLPLGAPVWLSTTQPLNPDQPLNRLLIAQDTGSAIKGVIRGDFFWGYGEAALAQAGRMKQAGRYFVLLPVRRGTS